MKCFLAAGCAVLTVLLQTSSGLSAAPKSVRLPKGRDSFFVENDLVYSRSLWLSSDGTYRQIDQDRSTSVEVDRGTWEQLADASVLLHSTYRGLRFRALLGGPLTLVLDSPEKIAALPAVSAAIHRLLANSEDIVFEAETAGELSVTPAVVSVDRHAETLRRDDLLSLAAQIDDTIRVEQTRTYLLTPMLLTNGPLLLILRGAVFSPEQIPAVCQDYHVPRGEAPPFYFAQTDAKTFANRVGRYWESRFPGEPLAP